MPLPAFIIGISRSDSLITQTLKRSKTSLGCRQIIVSKYDEIVTDLKNYFENSIDEVTDAKVPHSVDKKKESWVTSTYFYLKNRKHANIMAEIYDWSKRVEKEQNWGDNLKLSIHTRKV